jgi:hypothetical protein
MVVGNLLGFPLSPGGRIEGADWDHLSPEGVKIQVKAAAYWQAWKLRNQHDGSWRIATNDDFKKITKICFRGLWKRRSVGKAAASDFKADLYMFCGQHEKDPEKWDGADLSQWHFYMLPTTTLRELKKARDARYKNGNLPKSFDLALPDLEKHAKRMTALEFRIEAPKVIKFIATQLKRE